MTGAVKRKVQEVDREVAKKIVVPATALMVQGSVVKGPVSGATVTFYELDADGSRGAMLGTTTTDTDGTFTLALSPGPTASPFLGEASGGSYVDEVTGGTVTLAGSDRVTAMVPAGTTRLTISLLTHMAAARARELASTGVPLPIAVASSNIGIAQHFNVTDIIGTIPVAANSATAIQTSSIEQRTYGLALAAIVQEAQTLNVRAIDLAAAFAEDVTDGLFDGLIEAAGPISAPTIPEGSGFVTLPTTAATTDLQAAMDSFVASPSNQTNLTAAQVASVALPVGVNTAGLVYTTSSVPPAWISGQFGEFTFVVTGGTLPYRFALDTGSVLPGWLSLDPDTGRLYGPAPLLGGGITMTISPSFTIVVTDDDGNTYRYEVHITVVFPAPTLIPVTGNECEEKCPCTEQVATAAGGVSPYYFTSDSFATGAPPLGMIVDLNGNLTGKAAKKGSYSFGVCVVDSLGRQDCGITSINVKGAYVLSLGKAGTGSGAVGASPSPDACDGKYVEGTTVNLTAVAGAGSEFSGWSGDCAGGGGCTVVMDADKSATATFSPVSDCITSAITFVIPSETSDGMGCYSGSIAVSVTNVCPGATIVATASWGSTDTKTADGSGDASLTLNLPLHCPCLSGSITVTANGVEIYSFSSGCF